VRVVRLEERAFLLVFFATGVVTSIGVSTTSSVTASVGTTSASCSITGATTGSGATVASTTGVTTCVTTGAGVGATVVFVLFCQLRLALNLLEAIALRRFPIMKLSLKIVSSFLNSILKEKNPLPRKP
jgi:CBS domain containing-hemolysin-like protein